MRALSPAERQGLSVGMATALYGLSFGALAVASGLAIWQTCVLSLLMFTGGSQFAFVGALSSGGSAASGAASAVLLGARNGIYGVQVNAMLRPRGLRRVVAAQLTIDESTAVATAQRDPVERHRGFWVTGLAVFVGWNLLTFAGAVLGDALGDPRDYGLDGAASAAFLGLLWPRLRRGEAQVVAVAAAAVALALVPASSAGVPVLAAAGAAALIGLLAIRRRPA